MKIKDVIFILIFLLIGALFGGTISGVVEKDNGKYEEENGNFRKFSETLSVVEGYSGEKMEGNELIYKSIEKMLLVLDPHCNFFDPKEYKKIMEENEGRYYGLGIRIRQVSRDSGRIIIVEPPFPDTPAFRAGLQAGDVIFKVNGESIDDWTLDEVISRLKGPAGTKVHITVKRPGVEKPLEIDVERAEIKTYTINYSFRLKNDIGYIKIDRFASTTYDELEKAFAKLNVNTLKGLVLDLRGNPGGYLNMAIKVSESFLPKGAEIVSVKGRGGVVSDIYYAERTGNITLPLIILINNGSASASEIVSGALQDNDRALIVGERSFGKGLVQSVYNLNDGSALAITTGRYYLPSGRLIQRPYNGSVYDYYNKRLRKLQKPEKSKIFHTLEGRVVYGGGGITPDVVIKSKKMNAFQIELYSSDAYFKFIRAAQSGKFPELKGLFKKSKESHLTIGDEKLLSAFKSFIKTLDIPFSNKDFEDNRDYILIQLKGELYTFLFGIVSGYRERIKADDVFQKALNLFPRARNLLVNARKKYVKLSY